MKLNKKLIIIIIIFILSILLLIYCFKINRNFSTTKNNYRYNNPPIPSGFKKVNTKDASWVIKNNYIKDWNQGLVIEDDDGNQFVWVPVDNKNVKYQKWTTNNIKYNDPDLIDDKLPKGVISEEYQIKKYGGFYVGRYETAISLQNEFDLKEDPITIDSQMVKLRNITKKPIIQENAIPWTNITYINMKKNAESMYQTTKIKSGIITGTQWDTILSWFDNAKINLRDSTSWGNYQNTYLTNIGEYSPNWGGTWLNNQKVKTKQDAWLLKTGSIDYTKRKNIYDIAGNSWELTSEIYRNNNACVRGGATTSLGSVFSASYRHALDINQTSSVLSSRIVLYLT